MTKKEKFFNAFGRIQLACLLINMPFVISYILEELEPVELNDMHVAISGAWLGLLIVIGLLKSIKWCLKK